FLLVVFRTIYIQLDVVIISWLVSEEVIGWYSAADSLFSTMLFVPAIFLSAAFPALSRLHEEKSDKINTLMRKSFDMLMVISVPIGLGLFVLGDEIVVLLFGDGFAKSGAVLSIFGIVLIFTYLNMLVGRFLIATNRQRNWTVVMALAAAITVPLDFALVPWTQASFGNGAIGGALAFVVTEFGLLVFGIYLLPKSSLDRSNVWVGVRAIVAGAVMVFVVWQFRDLFIAIPIVLGMVTYLGLSWLFGIVPKEYVVWLQEMVKDLLVKFRQAHARVG
ncbi:MAG: oligosaccharide flippase family protein, partial [Anaerolineae bacterium]|nr:oligosaccharide flippase family protein [Anaerolineae bacterium]